MLGRRVYVSLQHSVEPPITSYALAGPYHSADDRRRTATMTNHWQPGESIIMRTVRENGRVGSALPMTVVQDGDHLVALYLAPGTLCKRSLFLTGNQLYLRDVVIPCTNVCAPGRPKRWLHANLLRIVHIRFYLPSRSSYESRAYLRSARASRQATAGSGSGTLRSGPMPGCVRRRHASAPRCRGDNGSCRS